MPSTINGIGTHYYGKKNVHTRAAACPHCGRGVELKSYDTRLWFVVFFIPIIPLGRKRIVDYCPACTRHFAVDAAKWETSKQLDVSGALDKYRAAKTPEAAIETHQALLNYHEFEQAAAFAQSMRESYPTNATIFAYLGAAQAHFGKDEEAAKDFARALELRPDLPEARVGVAAAKMRAGEVDEARKLLDFLEQPGAAQLYSLAPLEDLAYAFQRANRHTEALDLFAKLIAAYPQLGQNRQFRKQIEKSEKVTQSATMLPKKKFNWREFLGSERTLATQGPTFSRGGLIALGAIAVLVVAGLLISNIYIKGHRTLHIVSGVREPVTVQIDKLPPVVVRGHVTEVRLAEGKHHATITGAVRQEVDFDIRGSYFGRWFDDPAWVLNAGGSALLVLHEAVYAKSPRAGSFNFYYGEPFVHFGRVTHPFTTVPQSMRMKEHEERTLMQLEQLAPEKEAVNLLYHFAGQRQTNEALRFAEWRLRWAPDDDAMLEGYVRVGQPSQAARVAKFLRAGVTNRPVAIQWHRTYQTVAEGGRRSDELVALYDSMVAAEPTNSALLYLRGRISATQREANDWYERARAADARNPYPHFALAYHQMGRGDFAGAKNHLQKAVELRPDKSDFTEALFRARLALKEYAPLEDELRARLKKMSGDFQATLELTGLLGLQQKRAEAETVIAVCEQRLPARSREVAGPLLRRHLDYVLGDFAALEKRSAQDKTPAGQHALFFALIEQGRVAEAVRIHPLDEKEATDPYHFLAVSLAWSLAGDAAQAKAWRERASQLLDTGERGDTRAAALLRAPAPPSAEALDELVVPPRAKSLLLAVLARMHPAQAATFNAAAQQMNFDPEFPAHLVRRATAPAK